MLQLNAILNLGADAEAKTINDKKYISFRGASTEKKDGQDVVTWVSVLASFNENLLPYLKKGQQVYVSGRMAAGIYQSNNSFGIDVSVFAQTLQLCGGRREDSQQQTQAPAPANAPAPFPPKVDANGNPKNDDLPF